MGANHRKRKPHPGSSRGSTLTLAAISLVVLLAMAGLAIDLAMLYVARSEAQRAADAAALAGAQEVVDSSFPTGGASQAVAEALAADSAAKVGNQNLVIGVTPGLDPTKYAACGGGDTVPAGQDICFNFSSPGDPQVSVVAQRTAARGNAIPLFFMRIFGIDTADVSATATAEAFPSRTRCIKPWMLPNCDPDHTEPPAAGVSPPVPSDSNGNPNCPVTDSSGKVIAFAEYYLTPSPSDPSSALVVNPSPYAAGVVGEPLSLNQANPNQAPAPSKYYTADLSPSPAASICPACGKQSGAGGGGGNNPSASLYRENISCCNQNSIACGVQSITFINGAMPGPTAQGVDCLIHELPSGSGQDTISFDPSSGCSAASGLPFSICAGSNNPLVVSGSVQAGQTISPSDSLVVIPLYNGVAPCPGFSTGPSCQGTVAVDGFLIVFIKAETSPSGGGSETVQGYVVNVAPCSKLPTVLTSPIGVRLIHN